jgi:hypothetical protein
VQAANYKTTKNVQIKSNLKREKSTKMELKTKPDPSIIGQECNKKPTLQRTIDEKG